MKAEEIIIQLQKELPKHTDRFSSNVDVATITSVGTTATCTTAAAHNLATGHVVNVIGTQSPIDITSVARSGTMATVTTAEDHDLTEVVSSPVTIAGTSEAIFNGEFTLDTVPNRRTFTFTVADSGATSATGGQLQDPGAVGGYDGLVAVTVTGPTIFTYTLEFEQPNDAIAAIGEVRQALRITGAISDERADQHYTKFGNKEFWAFVILEDVIASKSRQGLNDAIDSGAMSGSQRQQIIQPFIVEVFSTVSNDPTGREARDDMEDLTSAIFSSLVGFQADSLLSSDAGNVVKFVDAGFIRYTTAYYVHGFRFQLLADIIQEDGVGGDFDVAFRDISLTMTTDLGTGVLTATIDLDDNPL